MLTNHDYVKCVQSDFGASAGTRTRVQALATLGDNHYTTLAEVILRLNRGINRYRRPVLFKSKSVVDIILVFASSH